MNSVLMFKYLFIRLLYVFCCFGIFMQLLNRFKFIDFQSDCF